MLDDALKAAIEKALDAQLLASSLRAVSGGCINESFAASLNDHTNIFIKVNADHQVLESEAYGLQILKRSSALASPQAKAIGRAGGKSFLVLEYLNLGTDAKASSWQALGSNLAAMHAMAKPEHGLDRDTIIGASIQKNLRHTSWSQFFITQRLSVQHDMAVRNGYKLCVWPELIEAAGKILESHEPSASLLHGDLWSGNVGFLEDGSPVVFDPAAYYGDRETDLALSQLFGGFHDAFYRAYNKAWPLPAGYEVRAELYNLYHLLNHLNLFGVGYLEQVKASIVRIIQSAKGLI